MSRNKDGIPLWDGDPATYTEFAEAARLYEQSVPPHKRAQAGPRIAAELTGAAKRYVTGQPASWLSYSGGVERLLGHLRQGLGQPRIVEVTEHLNRYFKASRRKSGETINEYLARKNEIYLRAQQALQRVLPHQATKTRSETGPSAASYQGNGSATWSRRTSMESQTEEADRAPDTESTTDPSTRATAWADEAWQSNSSYGVWSWNGSWQAPWYWDAWSTWDWKARPSGEEQMPLPELLPDFVQGWILLHDANLDQQERNLIQTAAGDNYSVASISQALRAQFPEGDLRRRDQGRRHQGLLGEWEGEDGADGEDYMDTEFGFRAEESLTEEGYAMWTAAQDEMEGALAALQGARRTLKNCPNAPKATANVTQEEAPFVMYANTMEEHSSMYVEDPKAEAAWSAQDLQSTAEAVDQGKCVIDSGATKSLGSIYALAKLMANNLATKGSAAVQQVDHENRPVFGFGNSSSDRCISTVTMALEAQGQPGRMQIHALNRGRGPVLLSIDALRKMGAQIDFANDLMILSKLSRRKVIHLERSTTGHQVLSLAHDLYSNATEVDRDVPLLSDFLSKPAEE
ncbi:hypothetical protein AK812_SmicGene38219 [Symbiodinium microadriaticum]|uniref:Uncharacterized protein n=1 Tax=Symbiodinium microadriaticum TaxID=2951 RepID=A0A1Q9CEB4_SYMMI|nr:hypothetical protein AK812_SmicGene38219 [Symbiodinium microadriaticum]